MAVKLIFQLFVCPSPPSLSFFMLFVLLSFILEMSKPEVVVQCSAQLISQSVGMCMVEGKVEWEKLTFREETFFSSIAVICLVTTFSDCFVSVIVWFLLGI